MADSNVGTILEYWEKPFLMLYIPVTYTIWSILWSIVSHIVPQDGDYRIHAQVFHLANLFIHVLNSIILFLIVFKLIKDKLSVLIGAILFGIHPVQVESVAYITELKTLLAFFFSLLSINLYLEYYLKQIQGEKVNFSTCFFYCLSITAFALALLSKPISVVVPVFIMIINHFFFNINIRDNVKKIIPWVVLSILMISITIAVQPIPASQYIPPFWLRPLIVLDTSTFYLTKLVYPDILGIDYARTPEFVLNQWWRYLTGAVSLGVFFVLFFLRRKYPLYLACFLIFLAGFLPASGIVPFQFQKFSTVADRYLYFSMMGPAIAVAVFFHNEKNLFHLMPVFIIVVSLMMTTFVQAKTWNNSVSLYVRAIENNSNSYWARNNLANFIVKDNPLGAIFLYREAITIKPDYREALANLATNVSLLKSVYPAFRIEQLVNSDKESARKESEYMEAGIKASQVNNTHAFQQFGRAVALNILNPEAYNNLGALCIRFSDYKRAQRLLKTAIDLFPENPEAMNNLAVAHYCLGDSKNSLEYFEKALKFGKYSAIILSNRDKVLKEVAESSKVTKKDIPTFECILQ
jgi:Flp pilus assembly protein TadD